MPAAPGGPEGQSRNYTPPHPRSIGAEFPFPLTTFRHLARLLDAGGPSLKRAEGNRKTSTGASMVPFSPWGRAACVFVERSSPLGIESRQRRHRR
jgi:hypothetical protein